MTDIHALQPLAGNYSIPSFEHARVRDDIAETVAWGRG